MPKPVIPTNVFAAFATGFCLRHCVFLCKGTKAPDCTPVSCLYCFCCFGKAGETTLLKKQAKFNGKGKPTLSMRWFPLSLRPSPLPFTDQGAPLDPRTPFFFFATGIMGFGSGPWVRLGIPGAKAANETGGLCPYSALLNWDTFCCRLDFY